VVLLSDGYELSPTCTYELEQTLGRGNAATIVPFMIGGRSVPHPKLNLKHNKLVDVADVEKSADEIVARVMQLLQESVRAPRRPS
jgi:hypothetical protein